MWKIISFLGGIYALFAMIGHIVNLNIFVAMLYLFAFVICIFIFLGSGNSNAIDIPQTSDPEDGSAHSSDFKIVSDKDKKQAIVASEYAKDNHMSEQEVIERLREGSLNGRLIEGVWYVSEVRS